MNKPLNPVTFSSAAELVSTYNQLKEEQPKARVRDLTTQMGIGEGVLLAARVGENVTRLRAEPEQILKALKPLGKLMALTRNEEVVHERKGVYDNLSFNRQGSMYIGLALNPDIDLRLFLHHWKHAFAVMDEARGKTLRSLQFFNASGVAIHKIYCTDDSDIAAYEALVQNFKDEDQSPALLAASPIPKPEPIQVLSDEDAETFRQAWRDLKDVHDFHPLLRRFKLDRQQAFNLVQGEYTQPVAPKALQQVLEAARDQKCDIMVFVGNSGCIQIHTGPVDNLMEMQDWFNVMDHDFNLHANTSGITSAWVVRKPSTDGIITSVELFNAAGESVVTFFGKRKPGIPELALWRTIVSDIESQLSLETL